MEKIFLEEWLHDIIERRVREVPEYHQFIGKEILEGITRSDVEDYQLFKLRKILSYAYQKSSFYKDLFNKNRVKPDDVRSLDDLAKIPFTEQKDLSETPYRFLCVSLGKIARVTSFITCGTTGPKKKVFWTEGDIELITDFMGAAVRTVATSEDVVQILLPGGRPNDQADLLAKGVKKMGAFAVVLGIGLSAEEQIRTIEKSCSNVLFGSVSRIYRITKEMQEDHNLGKMGVKALFLTSEYLSEPMREGLQDIWKCDVYTHYGLTEMGLGVGVECHNHNGFHFNEADLLIEVVNPETGKALNYDEEGELVFTTLSMEAMPLIRYRTHDISRLIARPCECGAFTLRKIGEVTKRVESITRIGEGDELYPALFDDVIYSIPSVIDYQVILTKEGGRDVITCKVEVTRKDPKVQEKIVEAMLNIHSVWKSVKVDMMAEIRIELVSFGELKRKGRAKRLIVDRRKSYSGGDPM